MFTSDVKRHSSIETWYMYTSDVKRHSFIVKWNNETSAVKTHDSKCMEHAYKCREKIHYL